MVIFSDNNFEVSIQEIDYGYGLDGHPVITRGLAGRIVTFGDGTISVVPDLRSEQVKAGKLSSLISGKVIAEGIASFRRENETEDDEYRRMICNFVN